LLKVQVKIKRKERIFKCAREKCQVTVKRNLIRLTANFSKETPEDRRALNDIFQV
jgi:hypothetical protein